MSCHCMHVTPSSHVISCHVSSFRVSPKEMSFSPPYLAQERLRGRLPLIQIRSYFFRRKRRRNQDQESTPRPRSRGIDQ